MATNNGGAAFPVVESVAGPPTPGMTLRDYFAAAALTGLVGARIPCDPEDGQPGELAASLGDLDFNWSDADGYAELAFRTADAMLEARER